MAYRFLLLIVFLLNFSTFAADVPFHKHALQLISQHFGKGDVSLSGDINQDAENYLKTVITLFNETEDYQSDLIPSQLSSMVSLFDRSSSISMGNHSIVCYGDGTVSINGKTQKTHVDNSDELAKSLKNGHWIAVRECLKNIALSAMKSFLRTGDEQIVQQAKIWASKNTVPEELRNKMLEAFAQTDNPDLINWLLKQPNFKDSAKDKLVQKMVDKALEADEPEDAEKLIKSHLQSGYSAQENASKKLFHYYFNKGKLVDADNVIVHHFTHGYSSYESLAKIMFDFYLYTNNDVKNAETCLRQHYTKGYSASDKLVGALCDYLIKKLQFDEARGIANRNMDNGYSAHTKLEKHILELELAYYKSKKS